MKDYRITITETKTSSTKLFKVHESDYIKSTEQKEAFINIIRIESERRGENPTTVISRYLVRPREDYAANRRAYPKPLRVNFYRVHNTTQACRQAAQPRNQVQTFLCECARATGRAARPAAAGDYYGSTCTRCSVDQLDHLSFNRCVVFSRT